MIVIIPIKLQLIANEQIVSQDLLSMNQAWLSTDFCTYCEVEKVAASDVTSLELGLKS